MALAEIRRRFGAAALGLIIAGTAAPVLAQRGGGFAAGRTPAPPRDAVNVLDHGVKGDGATDDAPALNAIFAKANGKTIFFPPNHTYYLGSTVGSGYPVTDPHAVLVKQQSNFHVIANGATFTIKAGSSGRPLGSFEFDRNTDFTWDGGTIEGNRTGLSAGDENAGLTVINNQRFRVSGVRFDGFGGNGGAIIGDWNVSATFSNLRMNGVGICFDTAFSKDLMISNVVARGADTNGESAAGHTGQKCFSNIYDVPLARYNYTGQSFEDTDGVTVQGLDASNFVTGVQLWSGRRFRFSHNRIHDNPGNGGGLGIGYWIYYSTRASTSSVGHPVTDVAIDGDNVQNNGAHVAGYGLFIDASLIANADVIDEVQVCNSVFDNNASTGISSNGKAIRNLAIGSNTYRGAAQAKALAQATANIARSSCAASAKAPSPRRKHPY